MESIVSYADSLARKNCEAVSFIPRPRLEEYAQHGQILVAFENGDPCGFLVFGNGFPTLRIYQACIQYDARRREQGLRLVRALITEADWRGVQAISLWCASDLESNGFWRAVGFELVTQRPGGSRRGRVHNLWRMHLSPVLFR